MTKFILKTYIKSICEEEDQYLSIFKVKTLEKKYIGHNNYLYWLEIWRDGEFYKDIKVFLTNDRNVAMNKCRGFDLNASCNNGTCLHQNECEYFVYNEKYNYGFFYNWKL